LQIQTIKRFWATLAPPQRAIFLIVLFFALVIFNAITLVTLGVWVAFSFLKGDRIVIKHPKRLLFVLSAILVLLIVGFIALLMIPAPPESQSDSTKVSLFLPDPNGFRSDWWFWDLSSEHCQETNITPQEWTASFGWPASSMSPLGDKGAVSIAPPRSISDLSYAFWPSESDCEDFREMISARNGLPQ
jgi:energy-coupling factor transporter transmembrane protein EcfT